MVVFFLGHVFPHVCCICTEYFPGPPCVCACIFDIPPEMGAVGWGRDGVGKQMIIDYSAFFVFLLVQILGHQGAQKRWSWTGADRRWRNGHLGWRRHRTPTQVRSKGYMWRARGGSGGDAGPDGNLNDNVLSTTTTTQITLYEGDVAYLLTYPFLTLSMPSVGILFHDIIPSHTCPVSSDCRYRSTQVRRTSSRATTQGQMSVSPR